MGNKKLIINLEDLNYEDVAKQVYLSGYEFHRAFSFLTGMTANAYIRNRRLYRATLDLQNTDDRVIDIAFRYCYETPESFAKAFARVHGATPSEVRAEKAPKPFLPLTITIYKRWIMTSINTS